MNKGSDDYFSMTDVEKEKQLAGYSLSELFSIVPSAITNQRLNGHKLVCKNTDRGFTVWTKVSESDTNIPFVPLNNSLNLTFLLKTTNSTFNHFTQVGLLNAGQFFFFSNNRLSTEDPGFPLIKKANSNVATDDAYRLNDESIKNEIQQLSREEQHNLFAIISIGIKGENGSYHITKQNGSLRNQHREFNIVFENRKTYWRYFFNSDQKIKPNDDVEKENNNKRQLVTKDMHPLTEKGFVTIELDGTELPNPDAKLIKPGEADNKIYSEIYM
ncbi:hypothetical protein [Draconibacterium halophilum]|uniref:Uncharacterized protein n=1 Tax=Draconibacterium halophilum TaxID=2706887 RepID=A0A6C0RFP1_9BACT|nr:hypothetical protein [Draconibacterium halophilum]QIA08485.1 hypothetical protein G0Q07_12510 [Draconibacterium halophilum]